jgi:integrase
MTEKVFCHTQDLDKKVKEISNWNISEQDRKKIPEFFRDYELGRITGIRGTNPQGSLLRYLYFLKVGLENLEGESKEKIEKFLENFLKDKIKSYDKDAKTYSGAPYALRSKKEIINILSRYLCWKNPSKIAMFKSVLSFKLRGKGGDIQTLNEEEIIKLLDSTDNSSKKFFLAVIASGGLRAEEFHNIRYSDIEMPKGKDMFVKLIVRNQFSKTKGRTIVLYDKWVLPAVKQYLAERIEEGIKPDEIVFKAKYYTNKKWVSKTGKKVLSKDINCHMFRHTAATRLASKMNRQQLCIYFGWSFSSSMPDKYIERAGVNMVDVEGKFASTNFEEQQKDIDKLKMSDKRLSAVLDLLMSNPDAAKALAKDRQKLRAVMAIK